MSLIDDIDAQLPQTQCTECGYPGCRPYAEAMAKGQEDIDRCPPGGVTTLIGLANLLKRDPTPYLKQVEENTRPPSVAKIREEECIGCTKCIQACPVDAILGTSKMMHTVISQECTGCGLCVDPCPVDCIDMLPQAQPCFQADVARRRFELRQQRLSKEKQPTQQDDSMQQTTEDKQAFIREAVARAKQKRLS